MTTAKETLPPELKAVTEYEVATLIAVGVPEITPVAESKDNPLGKAGAML